MTCSETKPCSWKKRLLLLAIACLVSAFMAELIVRIAVPQPLSGSWRVATESGLRVNKSSGTARHQLGERKVRYRFYPPHLRDTPRLATATEVLLLGDSFIFGWLLDREET